MKTLGEMVWERGELPADQSLPAPGSPARPPTDAQRKHAQHTALINVVLARTERIIKETRGRRYKVRK